MLIDSNNECSTLCDQGYVHRAEDLASRSSAKFRFSVGDRRVAPLSQQLSPSEQQENASALQAIRQVAYLGEQQKHRNGSIRKEAIAFFDGDQSVGNFAAPLSPLRDRDLRALSKLFLNDTMSAIEADIAQLLIRLQPEPCWEDDPFAFLQDFL
jgi:hypothetical protein